MDTPEPKVSFSSFLAKFPEIELPLTVAEDSARNFSLQNEPLSSAAIRQYIPDELEEEDEELTEYVPCFKIPNTGEVRAVVYWKASLLNYEYVMATYTKVGKPLARKTIAGTVVTADGIIVQSVATIDSDWIIYIASGKSATGEDGSYDASTSRTHVLELLANGMIVSSS